MDVTFLGLGGGVQSYRGTGGFAVPKMSIFMRSFCGRPIKSLIHLITWFIRKEKNKTIFTYFILQVLPRAPFLIN